jgi:hypothetical protein
MFVCFGYSALAGVSVMLAERCLAGYVTGGVFVCFGVYFLLLTYLSIKNDIDWWELRREIDKDESVIE